MSNFFLSKINRQNHGFTLIELLLYISIIFVILLSTSFFLYSILNSRVKNQSISEVEGQGAQAMQIITQTIRNGTLVNSPANGASGASLSVNTTVGANNPTVFDLSSGTIRIKEGAASAINLTSTKVTASGLTFQNLNNSIKLQFTLTRVNPQNINEYSYTQTFYGTANLRP